MVKQIAATVPSCHKGDRGGAGETGQGGRVERQQDEDQSQLQGFEMGVDEVMRGSAEARVLDGGPPWTPRQLD